MDDHNSDFHPETRGENVFSACPSLSMPFLWKPATIQTVADTSAPTQTVFSSPSSKSVRTQKHIVIHQPATVVVVVFNWRMIALQNFAVFCQTSKWINHRCTAISSLLKLPPISLPIPQSRLSIFHGTSHSISTKSSGPNENFAAMSTSVSQYHILSPLQNRYFGLRVETSTFPGLYGNMAAHGEGNGNPLQYSAWKIPWAEEPGGLQSMGSRRVGLDWATSLSLFTFLHWRRKWQPTPVFLSEESQGRVSLVGCRLWGYTESDTTEAT